MTVFRISRAGVAVLGAAGLVVASAGIASAHECINISKKNQAAGVQIVFGEGDAPVWVSSGLQKRIDAGLVDLETGDGFHGLIGIDFDGDLTNGGLAAVLVGGYSRMLGDAKRSPFTSIRGSADQWFAAVGLGYTF